MKLKEFDEASFYGISHYRIVEERPNDNVTLLDTSYPEVAEFGDDYEKVIDKYGDYEIVFADFSGEQFGAWCNSIYVDILIKG